MLRLSVREVRLVLLREGLGSGWGSSFAGLDIRRPFERVLFCCQVGLRLLRIAARLFIEITLQKRNTPAATGAGRGAFADLRGNTRFVNADVIHNLAFRYMKTEADLIVEFHGVSRN